MMKVLYSSTQSMPKWFILKALEKRMYPIFSAQIVRNESHEQVKKASDVEDGQEEDKNANVSPCEEDEDNEVNGNSDPSSAGSAPYSFSFEDDAPGVKRCVRCGELSLHVRKRLLGRTKCSCEGGLGRRRTGGAG